MRNMSILPRAATTTMPPAPFSSNSMKLLINTRAQRVLFAEAGKDVVDFILGLVAMPLGAVDRLLQPEGGSLGSIGNVYDSAEKMDAAYMQSTAARNALLVAPPPFNTSSDNDSSEPNHALPSPRLPQGSRGFVKDMAKYTIMDDLKVAPTTNISSVALLKSLRVTDLDALEERTVDFGRQEAMDIIKAAVQSKTVLTDAFLKSKRAHHAHMPSRYGFSNIADINSY